MYVSAQGLLNRPDAGLDLAVIAIAALALLALAVPELLRRRSRANPERWSPAAAIPPVAAETRAVQPSSQPPAPEVSAEAPLDRADSPAMTALRGPAVNAAAKKIAKPATRKRSAPPAE